MQKQKLIDLNNEEARKHFLKHSSYFNNDLPDYIKFTSMISAVADAMNGGCFNKSKSECPSHLRGVNYSLITNKDGRLAWRPLELMHPVIYVSLVNLICKAENWEHIKNKFDEFGKGVVKCYSIPVVSLDDQSDKAQQVYSWWQEIEQRSLTYSLEFSHMLHTDVSDCYGSLYTHSISWALHGLHKSKENREYKGKTALLGNKIDYHIRSGRCGQTNGISQGSVLMDFIAEIVLGYVDSEINKKLKDEGCLGEEHFRILRYRDDYRIFTNSDDDAEKILKLISDKLRLVGMKLGVAKTSTFHNVVEGSIKPDKLSAINLQDLGTTNAKTIQKQLLRIHSFGLLYPNSGALRRISRSL